jgi:hypothetical protein
MTIGLDMLFMYPNQLVMTMAGLTALVGFAGNQVAVSNVQEE